MPEPRGSTGLRAWVSETDRQPFNGLRIPYGQDLLAFGTASTKSVPQARPKKRFRKKVFTRFTKLFACKG
jgi:hypothetical protein